MRWFNWQYISKFNFSWFPNNSSSTKSAPCSSKLAQKGSNGSRQELVVTGRRSQRRISTHEQVRWNRRWDEKTPREVEKDWRRHHQVTCLQAGCSLKLQKLKSWKVGRSPRNLTEIRILVRYRRIQREQKDVDRPREPQHGNHKFRNKSSIPSKAINCVLFQMTTASVSVAWSHHCGGRSRQTLRRSRRHQSNGNESTPT